MDDIFSTHRMQMERKGKCVKFCIKSLEIVTHLCVANLFGFQKHSIHDNHVPLHEAGWRDYLKIVTANLRHSESIRSINNAAIGPILTRILFLFTDKAFSDLMQL